MKILITGVAGTGKTTMSKALKERGILAMDFSDIKGLCFWRDKKTKEKIEYYKPIENAEFFDIHERICDTKQLKEVLDQHQDIVITGVAAGNQTEYLSLFDTVFLLQCSAETFLHRMRTRDAIFGKTKAEQDLVVEWQKTFDPLLLSHGAIPINTEGSLETVVDKVIAQIK